ncbi:hypothetical protein FDUTEX481_03636 [Tolypothrix sp. PCC 7601]|nr:hypothetical protein FDUTEX481_03636 [Tolypothrix sp. PCC 7601]
MGIGCNWGLGNSGPPLGIRGNGEWGMGIYSHWCQLKLKAI